MSDEQIDPASAMLEVKEDIVIICDGCNVTTPFEHRCHESSSMVMGEQTNLPCECPSCREEEKLFDSHL